MSLVTNELQKICDQHGGFLNPSDVVDYAKNPTTALHQKFQWDDTKAAEQYRIWQARMIIRTEVTIIENLGKSFRTYVSLSEDRNGDGYRPMITVLTSAKLRKKLLEESLEEFEQWEAKYKEIQELAVIFAAAKSVKQKTALIAEANA